MGDAWLSGASGNFDVSEALGDVTASTAGPSSGDNRNP